MIAAQRPVSPQILRAERLSDLRVRVPRLPRRIASSVSLRAPWDPPESQVPRIPRSSGEQQQPRVENEPLHLQCVCAWLNLGDKHMTMAA